MSNTLPAKPTHINANNWMQPPYNRWSFQRVQQFTHTLRIPRSSISNPLPRQIQDLNDIVFTDRNNTPCTIGGLLINSYTDGFLVLHQGKIISEQYFNGMKADSLHLMMSCSKSFTSTLLGIYVDSGIIDCSALLTDYLPELTNTGFAGATLQQALDMQVGVEFSEDYDDLSAHWRDLEIATGWRDNDGSYHGPLDMLGYIKTLSHQSQRHGTLFDYKSVVTDVIGLCLERATGHNFAELFAEKIWQPLGCEQDLVSIVDSAGNAIFEGGFNCCLRDFARFGQMICQHGRWQGQQLVPKNWLHNCRQPNKELIQAFANSDMNHALPGGAYHNQWWVDEPQRGVLIGIGIYGQMLYIDSEAELVVAKFSSQADTDNIDMFRDQVLAVKAIQRGLSLES